jgi:RHS repeat-associated protein
VEVFFADFSVTHTGTDVVQKDDYYPFGGSFNAYTDLSTPQQDYLYNGVRLNKTTQLYETAFRTYDPYLGRFNHVDPLAAMIPSLSPYHFGFNNPVRYSDPLGLMGQDAGIWGTGDTYASNNSQNPFDFMPKFTRTNPGSGNHWSDGMGYSDWSMWIGSQMYRDGLAGEGFEFGGKFYHLDGDGNRIQYEERNGKLGYWMDSEMDVRDYVLINNKLFATTTPGVRSTFYSVGGQGNGTGLMMASFGYEDAGNISAYMVGTSEAFNDLYYMNKVRNTLANDPRFKISKAFSGNFKGYSRNVTNVFNEYRVMTAAGKALGKAMFGVGLVLTTYDIYENKGSTSSIVWGIADTGVAATALFLASNPMGWVVGAGAALYFTGRFAYSVYGAYNQVK